MSAPDKTTHIVLDGFDADVDYHVMGAYCIVCIVHCAGVVNAIYTIRKSPEKPHGELLDEGRHSIHFNVAFIARMIDEAPEAVERFPRLEAAA